MKKLKRYFFFIFFITFLAVFFKTIFFLYTPVHLSHQGMIYDLKPGTSITQFIDDLKTKHIIKSPFIYYVYINLHWKKQLKIGEYYLSPRATPASIWKQVREGSGLYQHRFSIIPGWTYKQLRQALNKEVLLTHHTLPNQALMKTIGAPNINPEGLFYPDTYFYTRGNSDLSILKRAYQLLLKKLEIAWKQRPPGLPYKSPYEALIAASLIEKEAYLSKEKFLIAGVLVNRLRADMALQFDPTVIYGLQDRFDGTIHKVDLQDNNFYNTYIKKGLPPTPIALVSLDSMKAALNPTSHRYLYFVAKGDGSHQFSETLDDHHRAVQEAAQRDTPFFNALLIKKLIKPHLQIN